MEPSRPSPRSAVPGDAVLHHRVVVLREELRVSRVVAMAQGVLMGGSGMTGEQAAHRLEQLRLALRATPERAAAHVLVRWSLDG